MRFPIVLALSWLSPSCRSLLSKARLVAINSDEKCIQGVHLFKAALSRPSSRAGRSIPRRVRQELDKQFRPYKFERDISDASFVSISPEIQEACKNLARPGRLVLPEHLLKEILQSDVRTREIIHEYLGTDLFNEMESKMTLPGFNTKERADLLEIRDRMEEAKYVH